MTSSSSAERELPVASPETPSPEWKREANRRLAIHRARRSSLTSMQAALPGMEERVEQDELSAPARNKSVASRVAERYAAAPTYSEMLAAEARNVARAATAAAVAAGEARDAAQAILVGLDADAYDEIPEEPLNRNAADPRAASPRSSFDALNRSRPMISEASEEDLEMEAEQESYAPVQPLPAKLLEFPRELVATRKARPRLAEGPLREEYDQDDVRSQLRIFEVEQETISTEPELKSTWQEWSPIHLDSPSPETAQEWHRQHAEDLAPVANPSAQSSFDLPLQTAPLEDRLMAGLVDASLIFGAFLLFVLVFVACTVHPPMGNPAMIGAGVALCAFAAIYHLLFFNFGTDTPGMRYAKIALCTFDDENPTRQAMRRRMLAVLLAIVPMGLGILWVFFDDDRLGWHDRISRTYQRSYR